MNTQHQNIWTENAELLQPAFIKASDAQTAELITLGILQHLPNKPCRIVDIGGGGGRQACLLASRGHYVTVFDIDDVMVEVAKRRVDELDRETASRISLVNGTVRDALATGCYDVVCCHSVLMYERNWQQLTKDLIALASPGGILSITSVNPEATAMRLGQQGRWREVIASISTGTQHDPTTVPSHPVMRGDVHDLLVANGVDIIGWYGVGVFELGSGDESLAAEWLAGMTEPYRRVARSFHLVGRLRS